MIVQRVDVRNFRSLFDASIACDQLTALVGRNGAGKSSFLHALELFYQPGARVSPKDFYDEDTTQDIEIAVTFHNLTAEEAASFESYVEDGRLEVIRVVSHDAGTKSGLYHGMRPQNPDFEAVRTAGGKRDITAAYNELRANEKYAGLPSARAADKALEALQQWEGEHSEQCVQSRDDGRFFRFTGGGDGDLSRYTEFVRIPAVRDAADDATEGRGSGVTEIMDRVVRNALATRDDVVTFKDQTQVRYQEILDPDKLTELVDLESQLNKTLQYYAPDSRVSLNWIDLPEIEIPLPEAQIGLQEDGYESDVQRTGHGLQRAFILILLQHLVAARRSGQPVEEDAEVGDKGGGRVEPTLPTLVLAIEEPELYQHPTRQRFMAAVLLELAHGSIPGVATSTQVIYTTHSPLFVGLDRFDQIRLFRKERRHADKPRTTVVIAADLNKAAEDLWILDGQRNEKYTARTLRARMQAVMTPWMNEGFFADLVVLVEGDGDHAVVLAAAESMGVDLNSLGIAVVPCRGKRNMDRPTIAFRNLGIETYLVWDNDKDGKQAKPHENRRLLRLMGAAEDNWPDGVWATHACLNGNLETVLRRELSEELFDELVDRIRGELRMKRKDAKKHPYVLGRIVYEANKIDRSSATLKAIIERLVNRRADNNKQVMG